MAEAINVGQTLQYEAVWFDGPNGTGNEMKDPGQGSFVSDNPAVLSTNPTGLQTVDVSGQTAGTANVQATSSTGVQAGFLDSTGAFQTGPLAFLVSAAATIVSGILRRVASVSTLAKRS